MIASKNDFNKQPTVSEMENLLSSFGANVCGFAMAGHY